MTLHPLSILSILFILSVLPHTLTHFQRPSLQSSQRLSPFLHNHEPSLPTPSTGSRYHSIVLFFNRMNSHLLFHSAFRISFLSSLPISPSSFPVHPINLKQLLYITITITKSKNIKKTHIRHPVRAVNKKKKKEDKSRRKKKKKADILSHPRPTAASPSTSNTNTSSNIRDNKQWVCHSQSQPSQKVPFSGRVSKKKGG
ncbi:hypothetical protein EX30DRAFT_76118 [Ascodesmis nigricans]|uniref:Transmembrane protein n=1 Tax=Ascodesmis nigricans TaxID=341454 RepID=A0A4S2MTG2_9PEZI|nr:hypothetical protein EX30DRAFT_76118 [Ascodesmis nigricans]